jgi:Glycosyltransferase family 87
MIVRVSAIASRVHVPLAGLGLALVGLLALSLVAASRPGSPLPPGRPESTDLPGVVFLVAAGGAFALYVLAVVVIRRRGPSLAFVCGVAAAIQLIPLAGPLLLSRDVYAYWTYGRLITAHDANPYAVAPSTYGADPGELQMAPAWRGTRSVYGPVFSAASAGLATATGRSAETTAFTYRLLAALGMLALVGLAVVVAPMPAFAAAFVGWNPMLALNFAGGGHNDVWMVAFVLAALALASRRRPVLAGASWAMAVGVKWVPLALLPLSLIAARGRYARRIAAGFLVALIAIGAGACLAFGSAWLTALMPLTRHHAGFSLPSRLVELGFPRPLADLAAAAPLLVALPWLLRDARAGRSRLALAAGLMVVASPWVLPWYAVWMVPLAAIEEDRLAWVLALAVCAYLLPDRVPL